MTSKRHMAARVALIGKVWLAVGAFALLLVAFGEDVPSGLTKPVSVILLVLAFASFGFEQWAWRWKWLNWLTQRPDLGGTWKGTLRSRYVDPETNEQVPEREVYLVVHQTLTDLHLRLLTEESSSSTLVAALRDEPDGRHTVAAVYRNEPKIEVRERSEIHRGALQLQLGGQEGDRLRGEYWTDRATNGSLELARISREEATDFEGASEFAPPI